MNVPLIGQHRPPPAVNVSVGVTPPAITMRITYNGVQHADAPMSIEIAVETMMNLGSAIEQLQPGQLIEVLKAWQQKLSVGAHEEIKNG